MTDPRLIESAWPTSLLPPPPPPPPPGADRPWMGRRAMWFIPAGVVAIIIALQALGTSDNVEQHLEPGDVVTDLNNLRRGQCIDDSTFDEPDAVLSGLITIAACDGPHDVEVSRVHNLEADEGATYPGESAILEQSLEICQPAFGSYVGVDYYESDLDFSAYYPSEQTWRKYDDRTIVCAVFDPSLEPLARSVEDPER
jgi:Septum formation